MQVYREIGVLILTMLLLLILLTKYTIFLIDLITNAGSCLWPTNNGGNVNKHKGSESMVTARKDHDARQMQHTNEFSAFSPGEFPMNLTLWGGMRRSHEMNTKHRCLTKYVAHARCLYALMFSCVIDNILPFLQKNIKTGNNGNNEVRPNVSM